MQNTSRSARTVRFIPHRHQISALAIRCAPERRAHPSASTSAPSAHPAETTSHPWPPRTNATTYNTKRALDIRVSDIFRSDFVDIDIDIAGAAGKITVPLRIYLP